MTLLETSTALGPAPHDPDAESAVLGAMMISEESCAVALDRLTAAMFYAPAHQIIFTAILEEFGVGGVPDPLRVSHRLAERGLTREAGGPTYLLGLVGVVPATANTSYWADIVAAHARARTVIAGLTRGLQAAGAGTPAETVIEQVSTDLSAAVEGTGGGAVLTFADALDAAIAEIAHADADPDGMVGIPTGLASLDSVLGGLRAGDLTVIGGRPSMGKSLLGSQIAVHAATAGHPVLLASLEMNGASIAKRALAAASRVGLTRLMNGGLSDADWVRVQAARETLAGLPLDLYCHGGATPAAIRTEAHRLLLRHGRAATPLIVVDYLQLLGSARRAESRQVEVSEQSRSMKSLAVELDASVVAISQLNRSVEARTDRRPMMSDLRESGSLEQDSDVVLLLYREDYYDQGSPRVGEIDMIIAKHRNGALATATAAFLPHHGRISDFADV